MRRRSLFRPRRNEERAIRELYRLFRAVRLKMFDLVWRWIVVAPADVLAALVAISLYWLPALVGLRAASLAYRYAAGRHAAKLDQTQPIPAIIATIVCFYIFLVMMMTLDTLPSSIQWAKNLSFRCDFPFPTDCRMIRN